MGIPSVGILLHEVIKLMYHAKVRDPVFFRIGTCGGIGYEGGTVVISEEAMDGALRNVFELVRIQTFDHHHSPTIIPLTGVGRTCFSSCGDNDSPINV
jgi:uridine phosphorylase